MKRTIDLKTYPMFWATLIILPLLVGACEKNSTLPGSIYETEVYIMGYNPCVRQNIVNTPAGKGKVFLAKTIQTNPDTVMLYGVPSDLVQIPGGWNSTESGFLFSEEGQRKLKMRIYYQVPSEKIPIICTADIYYPPMFHNRDQYIIIKAEMIE